METCSKSHIDRDDARHCLEENVNGSTVYRAYLRIDVWRFEGENTNQMHQVKSNVRQIAKEQENKSCLLWLVCAQLRAELLSVCCFSLNIYFSYFMLWKQCYHNAVFQIEKQIRVCSKRQSSVNNVTQYYSLICLFFLLTCGLIGE